jgi:hypothetical protein
VGKCGSYRLGPDVPDDEQLRDREGRLIDDAYVDAAVEDALRQVRGRGRPSLSQAGESPLLRVRISKELDEAVRKAADSSGALTLGVGAPRTGRSGPPPRLSVGGDDRPVDHSSYAVTNRSTLPRPSGSS